MKNKEVGIILGIVALLYVIALPLIITLVGWEYWMSVWIVYNITWICSMIVVGIAWTISPTINNYVEKSVQNDN